MKKNKSTKKIEKTRKVFGKGKRQKDKKREIDRVAADTKSFVKEKLVFIKKSKVAAWKAVFILAFAIGATTSIVWMIYERLQTTSSASSASLYIETSDEDQSIFFGEAIETDIMLDSLGNDVVVAKAIVEYDPQLLELQSWDTSGSIFSPDNSCAYSGKPCEIIDNDPTNGKITITLARPTPGVNTGGGLIASLTFKSIGVYGPYTDEDGNPKYYPADIKLDYDEMGSYNDSDVIIDDGSGTDILEGVDYLSINIDLPVCSDSDFKYSDWSECKGGKQTRTFHTSNLCKGGTPVLEQTCGNKSVCTNYNYSDWGTCQSDGIQTRTIASYVPAGCSGGAALVLSRKCTYNPPPVEVVSDNEEVDKKSDDKESPKITDLPWLLSKKRGEKIWWKGTDNKKVDHYTYTFNNKKVKTKRASFNIPTNIKKGAYVLKVSAYDKTGNKKTKRSVIRVR